MKLTKLECPKCLFFQNDIELKDLGDGTYTYEGDCPHCEKQMLVILNISDPSEVPF